ncbi:AAA family ATPase [Pseudomonas coronafaciens]|uniref:AAA family ATPase n=1 Tax=Pseudomonas coronafaciens TaxID=53409 RepID=UPI00177E6FB5|nr:AAA family ATPase [Pseudomonas coronafaciens]
MNTKENAPGLEGRKDGKRLEQNGLLTNDQHDAALGPRPTPLIDAESLIRAGLTLIPLHRWDAVDHRSGRPRGKTPIDNKWQDKAYNSREVLNQARIKGLNVGVRLPASYVVLDVDPRNFGGPDDPDNKAGVDRLDELVRTFNIDLKLAPHTITGSGGHHYWFKKPVEAVILDSLKAYPGIEFKSFGRQVVAAGSVHPGGQKKVNPAKAARYRWDDFAPPVDEAPNFPERLLAVITRPNYVHGEALSGGELTPEMLTETLEQIDPADYSEESIWRSIMMASHHATHGEGRQEFIDWSTRDPDYADSAWEIGCRWDSLHLETSRGGQPITVKFLHKLLNDLGLQVAHSKAEDDFEDWVADAADHSLTKPRWNFLSIEELESLPPPRWLIQGLLTEASLVAIYGAPESGKSFLAVDMAMAISGSLSWHGRSVLGGGVLYIAAEGAPGLGKRVRAWKKAYSAEHEKFKFILMRDSINFASENDAESKMFIKTVLDKCGPLKLVIIDTLNQTAAGADENSAKDMSLYIDSMKRLRDGTGATVVVVHHSGKDSSKGMRGSTALIGAMDTTIEVDPAKDFRSMTVSVRKQKDAEKELPIRFSLEPIDDSLVLRDKLIADIEDDFLPNENPFLTEICEMVREAGGKITLKKVIDAFKSNGKSSESTVRRKVTKLIPEGPDRAITVSDLKLWRKRMTNNPNGDLEIISEKIQRLS